MAGRSAVATGPCCPAAGPGRRGTGTGTGSPGRHRAGGKAGARRRRSASGPLEDLLADETVDRDHGQPLRRDLHRTRPAAHQVGDHLHQRRRGDVGAIERIVAPLGRRIDESSPMVDARLKDGSRVNAVIPPLALKGAVHHDPQVLEEEAAGRRPDRFGSMSQPMLDFLKISGRAAAQHRSSRAAPARARPRCSTCCRASSRRTSASSPSKTRPNCSSRSPP
jgi:hypothetical protein